MRRQAGNFSMCPTVVPGLIGVEMNLDSRLPACATLDGERTSGEGGVRIDSSGGEGVRPGSG
jgi:hypothetical protein